MGYNCYISRRQHWHEQDNDIAPAEWLDLVKKDHTLIQESKDVDYFTLWQDGPEGTPQWLDWSDGNIYSKNPTPALIIKMHQIAQQLNARVLGDDGECYGADGLPQPESSSLWLSFKQKIRHVYRYPWQPKPVPIQSSLPFAENDQVKDLWGNQWTVQSIDLNANHGLGYILLRREDGSVTGYTAIAHGLTKVTPLTEISNQ